jgi:two-component system cell cycle response regulator
MSEPTRTIVIVEDDADVRATVELLLKSAGHQVSSTTSSKDALALVKRERPRLVLCDIAMPELDGYGVLRELQADAETADTPVVFLTAHREFSERVRAFKAGAVDYVTKPFTRETLVRKVERILKGIERRASLQELRAEAGDSPAEPAPTVASAAERDPASLVAGNGSLPPFSNLPELLRSVLVVDDNSTFRRFVAGILERQDFKVYEAQDGEEALRVALEKRPWLILADVAMPGIDGFELLRRVRSQSLIGHTPFVFLSGWDDHRDRQRGLQLGADEFLSKQTNVRELLIRIHLLLHRFSDAVGAPSARRPVIEGGIELTGAPGLLQMWHQSRQTGVCTARSGQDVFEARFHDGEIVGATLGELAGIDAIYAFLAWEHGHFRFAPGPVEGGAPLGESFDQMLLEGCRLLDEGRRGAEAGDATARPAG